MLVSLAGGDSKAHVTGTVYEKTSHTIAVAPFRYVPDWLEEGDTFEIHRSLNRVTYKRMYEALDEVLETENTRLARFRDISFELSKPTREGLSEKIQWFDLGLNTSQKLAVERGLEANDIALLHGPPGTGKTTALVEIIRQSAALGKSVFVTAPSNTACDNLLERLVVSGVNALRLGHPARITPALREHTLDFKLALHPLAKIISETEAEVYRLEKRRERYDQRRSPGISKEFEVKGEISHLKQEIRKIQKEIFERVMEDSQVIIGTPVSIEDKVLREEFFDLLVIDEATQATEPLAWIVMARAKKVIMAGDHFQLPPTVRSPEAESKGLGVTLFERYYRVLPEDFRTLLERQYRMNEKIMGFSSKKFYENKLVADESVRQWTLADIAGVRRCPETEETFLFIDTAGKGFEERLEEGSESRYNPEEAEIVLDVLGKMLSLGVPPSEIAVIGPYSAQVRLLASKKPHSDIEVDSVDGFQGREKELVIVSLVRSNMEGTMGFLADTRRMNVAMTRARKKLVVIGDSATLSSIKFYKDFIKYAQEVGGYKTVWEL